MEPRPQKTILSGIQPIDRLMGGLDSGELYLVHGEASGKSLSGITFLIEGLKGGEHGALVVGCPHEEAVRRFARVGYDCLEDVLAGLLVILEYSDDLVEQISRPGQLTPALRELEWLLGETRPRRLVFDPVTSVVAGDRAQLEARVAEFAEWAKSIGATAMLIGHAGNTEVTNFFKLHVAESFRFEMREDTDRMTEVIVFEKSDPFADHPIDVDTSRGIFLSDRAQPTRSSPAPISTPRHDFRLLDLDTPPSKQQERETTSGPETGAQDARRDYTAGQVDEVAPLELDMEGIEDALSRLVDTKAGETEPQHPGLDGFSGVEPDSTTTQGPEGNDDAAFDLASELFGETERAFLSDDPDIGKSGPRQSDETGLPATESFEQSPATLAGPTSELWSASAVAPPEALSGQGMHADTAALASSPARTGKRASDVKINAALAARAVETLLGQEKTIDTTSDNAAAAAPAPAPAPPAEKSIDPKSFKVLLIDDESGSCEMVVQSLSDFTIEKIHDGVSGLARLISYKPDLLVLDLDVNAIDGFKLLAHIRARLNVPVIIVSSKLVRSSEGTPAPGSATQTDSGGSQLAKTLAASGYYHLTTEVSTDELTQKARQLIARYRGIYPWITSLCTQASERPSSTASSDSTNEAQDLSDDDYDDRFRSYDQFVAEVEKRVKAVIESGSALSIVGCRVEQMTTAYGDKALSTLRGVIRDLVRDTDLASTNVPGDVVILLADARASGARAFANRLRETIAQKLNQQPSVWMRTFPRLEEETETPILSRSPTNGGPHRRRATD
ncbi:MAG TPA: ATPase domain-containing protein [Blastocatellia bacterium]|nr:ATPase domain-containing protein [Blastocatellia bacterium]